MKKTTKKPAAKKAAGTRPDAGNIDGLLEDAKAGDRYALAMLYGTAAAWLRADKSPPPKLRGWIVEILSELHQIAWTEHRAPAGERIPEAERTKNLSKATRFARGRGAPKSRRSAREERSIAADFLHALTFDGAKTQEEALEMVAAYRRRYGLPEVSDDQINAAWKKYRREFPEIRTVKSESR